MGGSGSLEEIYERICLHSLYNFGAKEPKTVLRITLDRHCANKSLSVMNSKKIFIKRSNGAYSLIQEEDNKIVSAEYVIKDDEVNLSIIEMKKMAKQQRDKVKQEIAACLRNLPPEKFENFCRIFLKRYGFSKMALTSRGRDGGIDIYGLLKVGIANMRVAVQCKRYALDNKVGRPAISGFRGDITGEYEQGIFITTSSFTKEAEDISFKPGCVPVILIDGEQLAEFMLERQIGVIQESIAVYSFEEDLLWNESDYLYLTQPL
nr:restriction endonuclease [Franconibacter sp. IITDAS19]